MKKLEGNLAKSKAGHDKDELFIILRAEGDYVYLADGKCKTVEKPKRKKIKHIQPIFLGSSALDNTESITNEQIKRTLKLYK